MDAWALFLSCASAMDAKETVALSDFGGALDLSWIETVSLDASLVDDLRRFEGLDLSAELITAAGLAACAVLCQCCVF